MDSETDHARRHRARLSFLPRIDVSGFYECMARLLRPVSLPTVVRRFFTNLVPRTGVTIQDLDQAVAVTAGTAVLAFSLHGALAPRWQKWRADVRTSRERQMYEMQRLQRIRDNRAREISRRL